MAPRLLLLALLALAACEPWVVNFQPRSAAQDRSRETKRAIQFFEDDADALEEAGGKVAGTLELRAASGWVLTGGLTEVHQKAAEEAAKAGATHYFYLAPEVAHGTYATVYKAFGVTVAEMGTTTTLKGGRYLLVRVPPKSWEKLPTGLKPIGDLLPRPKSCHRSLNFPYSVRRVAWRQHPGVTGDRPACAQAIEAAQHPVSAGHH